jgi:hypothetical protein
MRMRRYERVAAATLLTVLAASLFLIARPAGSASAADFGRDVTPSIRYGCSDGGWVEVTLSPNHDPDDAQTNASNLPVDPPVFQVGLAGPDSQGADAQYPEGGPSLVVTGDQPATVRLAGPINTDDHVFIKRVSNGAVIVAPLSDDCHHQQPTDFGLDQPQLRLAATSCTNSTMARVDVGLTNPNPVDSTVQRLGLNEIDYTVLLVRAADDQLMTPNNGQLLRFDGRGDQPAALAAPAKVPTDYEVRAIGLDGAVVSTGHFAVSCAVPLGSKPPTSHPTATPTATVSSTNTSPRTTPVPTHTPSRTPSPTPTVAHTSTHTSASATQPGAGVATTPDGSPGSPQPGFVSQPSNASSAPATGTSRPGGAIRTSTGAPNPSATSSSSNSLGGQPGDTASPSPSPTGRLTLANEPPGGFHGLLAWQPALVVAIDAMAIAALVGATVWRARRR